MARICNLTELSPGPPVALTIGVFDGVHRGHQVLIGEAVRRARLLGGQCIALTFYPHPRAVLMPGATVYELTSFTERLELIAALGVDVVATLEFTRALSMLSAEAFIELAQQHIALRELVVGSDFALGRNRAGTVPRLREIGQGRGFAVHAIEPIDLGGIRVSSSKVREVIAAGDIETATRLLGRFPRLEGIVVAGHKRGRTLGFPTANLALTAPYLLPANGIYAVYAETDGTSLPGVANIGTRPTFGDNDRLVEVYVLDFDGDLYGRRLGVHLVKRLRDEVRFASVGALVEQMRRDAAAARAALAVQDRAG